MANAFCGGGGVAQSTGKVQKHQEERERCHSPLLPETTLSSAASTPTTVAAAAADDDDDDISTRILAAVAQDAPVTKIAHALATRGEEYLSIRNMLTQCCDRPLSTTEKNCVKKGIRLAKQERQHMVGLTEQIHDLEEDAHWQRELSASARKASWILFTILACTVCLQLSFWVVFFLLVLLWWLLQKDMENTFFSHPDRVAAEASPQRRRRRRGAMTLASGSAFGMSKSLGGNRRFSGASPGSASSAAVLPQVTSWPLRPVLLRMSSDGPTTVLRPPPRANTFRTFPINTAHFEGHMLVLLRNAPCAEQTRLDAYFEGHRRVSVNYVQGRFKRRLPLDQVLTGQTFQRPLVNMPSQMLIKVAFGFLRGLAPSLHADVTNVKPYILTPLISAAQSVHIASSSDAAPDLVRAAHRELSDQDMEDTRMLMTDGGDGGGSGAQGRGSDNNINSWSHKTRLSAASRRKAFKNARSLRGKYFEPAHTYTFGFWQDLFDPVDYGAHLPFGTFDVSAYLDGQALQIQAQVGKESVPAADHLWRVDLWNEKLLAGLAQAKAEGRA